MAALIVEAGHAKWGDATFPCAIGRAGTIAAGAKREGDGRSPVGIWPARTVLLRPERGLPPPARMPWRWLRPDDGWCDDPGDPAYNRPVRHPYAASAEWLWRDDGLYDAILCLDHNDSPPHPGAGSAIFVHLLADRPTAGCVAIRHDLMALLLAELEPGDAIDIRA